MPKSWNEGTVTGYAYWTAQSGSGDVVWGWRAMALSNDDALDTAFGTAATATDTLLLANDVHVSGGMTITVAGTPAAGDISVFEVYRDANNGSDTLAVDAELLGFKIEYTIDAANDD
jgi:hypothetical protein